MALSRSVGVPRGVFALPGILGDLADTTGAGLRFLPCLATNLAGLGSSAGVAVESASVRFPYARSSFSAAFFSIRLVTWE